MSNFSIGDNVRINSNKLNALIMGTDPQSSIAPPKNCEKLWNYFLSHPFSSYRITGINDKDEVQMDLYDSGLKECFYPSDWIIATDVNLTDYQKPMLNKKWYMIDISGKKNGIMIVDLDDSELNYIEKLLNDAFKKDSIYFHLNKTSYQSYADAAEIAHKK